MTSLLSLHRYQVRYVIVRLRSFEFVELMRFVVRAVDACFVSLELAKLVVKP